jgi:hypothetical protein
MLRKFSLLFTAILALSANCMAAEESLPKSLIYQNKPIDPLCISENNSNDLSKCGINAEPDRSISGDNAIMKSKGFYGYEYQIKNMGPTRGYSYYKVIGKSADADVVYSVSSGGGSGEFTMFALVKRKDSTLKVTTIASGDRCNGGVSEGSVKDGKLTYHLNLTPLDYTGLALTNPHLLKSQDDLQYCAACCAGYAVYAYPLNNDMENTKLLGVDFKGYPAKELEKDEPKPYQRCFDKLLGEYQSRGQTFIEGKAIPAFVDEFYRVCYTQPLPAH